MNKTFKKILSVCCTVLTTLTATLFRSTELRAYNTYKIVFIGDEKVGKTQLVNRIASDGFSDDYECTIGLGFFGSTPTARGLLQLWDLAGEKRSRNTITEFYPKTDVMLYCCSCDRIDSQSQQRLEQSFDIPAKSPVMLCITKEDEIHQSAQSDTDDFNQEKLQKILTQFRDANAGCNILSEILVTSAKNNQYKLCKPENYDTTDCKDIHQNLATDLVNLCRGQEAAQNTGDAGATKNTSLYDIDNSSNGKKPKLHMQYWLGVPISLISLGLIGGLGCYYGYDRHKKKKAVNHPTGKYIQHEKKRLTKTIKC